MRQKLAGSAGLAALMLFLAAEGGGRCGRPADRRRHGATESRCGAHACQAGSRRQLPRRRRHDGAPLGCTLGRSRHRRLPAEGRRQNRRDRRSRRDRPVAGARKRQRRHGRSAAEGRRQPERRAGERDDAAARCDQRRQAGPDQAAHRARRERQRRDDQSEDHAADVGDRRWSPGNRHDAAGSGRQRPGGDDGRLLGTDLCGARRQRRDRANS